MRTVAVSGTRRELSARARSLIAPQIIDLLALSDDGEPTVLLHGCQTGLDIFAARIANLVGAEVCAVVPGRMSVDPRWRKCSHRHVMCNDYHERNDFMVVEADEMRMWPEHAELDTRSRGSGTWSVIRKARKREVPHQFWALDELLGR